MYQTTWTTFVMWLLQLSVFRFNKHEAKMNCSGSKWMNTARPNVPLNYRHISMWITFIGAAFFALCWRSAACTKVERNHSFSLDWFILPSFFPAPARFAVFGFLLVCCSGCLILLLVFVCMSTRNTANMKHAKSMFIFGVIATSKFFAIRCPFCCVLSSILPH